MGHYHVHPVMGHPVDYHEPAVDSDPDERIHCIVLWHDDGSPADVPSICGTYQT